MAEKTAHMAVFARIIFGLLRHKYISCNKHELEPKLAITRNNSFMMIEYSISLYLNYLKLFSPCLDFIIPRENEGQRGILRALAGICHVHESYF